MSAEWGRNAVLAGGQTDCSVCRETDNGEPYVAMTVERTLDSASE